MKTTVEIAKIWGVTPRYVQTLCQKSRIQGAERKGRDWLIPENAPRPADKRRKSEETPAERPLIRKSPFLDMTDLYSAPGSADKCIEALAQTPEAQALFAAEIAYSRGEIHKVYGYARYFLHSHSSFYAVNAGGMLLALSAMWKGDISLWREAKLHICEAPCKSDNDRDILALSLACVDSSIRDLSDYPRWFTRGSFEHLPKDAHPSAKVFYIKYLLVFAQEMAKGQFKLEDVTGMGLMKSIPYITEPMIAQAMVDKTVIPEIYLRLLCAIAYHQSGDDISAIAHIDKAIALALPDRLLGILAEHRRQFDYLLDDRLKLADFEAYKTFILLHKQLLEGWTKLHNAVLERSVSTKLSVRERQIARLAAFGLSNSEIARQLCISESAVKKAVYDSMNKTGVNRREHLGAFI